MAALLLQGCSNKLIARDLGLSPNTVKRHVARMLEKSGQGSRHQLAAWYRGVSGAPARASA